VFALDSYTAAETRLFARLKRPYDIQRFLDEEVAYNKEPDGATSRSPRVLMRDRVGHCMEGALFAAAALEFQGHPPTLIDLEAVRDVDHVLAVFRLNGRWGSIGKSNYSGLRYREPVYASIRELAMSYFEHYFNLRRERTLRGYSRPVGLKRFDWMQWRTTEDPVWEIPNFLSTVRHYPLISLRHPLTPVDRRLFEAGRLGSH
jgi:hypothetical protein